MLDDHPLMPAGFRQTISDINKEITLNRLEGQREICLTTEEAEQWLEYTAALKAEVKILEDELDTHECEVGDSWCECDCHDD